jgi:hypothetical protein
MGFWVFPVYMANMNMSHLATWIKRYYLDEDKLWKQIILLKSRVNNSNIFSCSSSSVLHFWKGALWAAEAVKMGYQWKTGNGRSIKFWEDYWFGSSSLAIWYWKVYCIANEQKYIVAELWDGD